MSDRDGATDIRARVLRGIAGNRTAGLHFAGHFLDVQWPVVETDRAVITLPDGSHVRDAQGAVARTVLVLLADMVVGTAARLGVAAGARLATVHLHLQFTGVPARGDIVAEAFARGPGPGTGASSWLGAGTIHADGKPVCYADGEFHHLQPPPGVTLAPLPWQRDTADAALPDEASLTPPERSVLAAADDALDRASHEATFIEHFWGGERVAVPDGAGRAQRRLVIGPHIGNRVGHVQGGITLGVAVGTACDAAPPTMTLSSVSAWYLRPGQGDALRARAEVVYAGRTTAMVRTQVIGSDDVLALEAVTQHVRAASP
jgi:acyl-coenzyme A thioesterase PaaI-like protein